MTGMYIFTRATDQGAHQLHLSTSDSVVRDIDVNGWFPLPGHYGQRFVAFVRTDETTGVEGVHVLPFDGDTPLAGEVRQVAAPYETQGPPICQYMDGRVMVRASQGNNRYLLISPDDKEYVRLPDGCIPMQMVRTGNQGAMLLCRDQTERRFVWVDEKLTVAGELPMCGTHAVSTNYGILVYDDMSSTTMDIHDPVTGKLLQTLDVGVWFASRGQYDWWRPLDLLDGHLLRVSVGWATFFLDLNDGTTRWEDDAIQCSFFIEPMPLEVMGRLRRPAPSSSQKPPIIRKPKVLIQAERDMIGAGKRLIPTATNRPAPGMVQSWLNVDRKRSAPLVVNVSYVDLAEIGHELAKGFIRYTDWGYWTTSVDSNWLQQRCWWNVDVTSPDEAGVLHDMLQAADIIHINEYHNYPWITDELVGKKVIIHHHGCEYRDDPTAWEQQETEAGYTRITSTPDLLIHGSPQYRKNLTWLPSPIDLDEFDRNYPRWDRSTDPSAPVRVLHAYTVAEQKGTYEIFDAVQELQAEGENVELELVHRVGRRQCTWYLSQADIFFATFLYGPGLASIEAMAFGIPTLVGCNPDELRKHMDVSKVRNPDDLPWVYVTKQTVKDTIRRFVRDPKLRNRIGLRGRRYVERYHSLPVVVRKLQKIYEQTKPCTGIVEGQ